MEHLDTTGTFCPVPILLTARKIKEMTPGDHLQIVGDDPGIVVDMPVWCDETGHRLISLEQNGSLVCCIVERI